MTKLETIDTCRLEQAPSCDVQIGDVLQNRVSGFRYVCVEIVNGTPVLIRTVTLTNPSEWARIIPLRRVKGI